MGGRRAQEKTRKDVLQGKGQGRMEMDTVEKEDRGRRGRECRKIRDRGE